MFQFRMIEKLCRWMVVMVAQQTMYLMYLMALSCTPQKG